jgi:hypothetical protein
MKKAKKVLTGLALSAIFLLGVAWGGSPTQSSQAKATDFIVKPGHGTVAVAMVELADAAKQLDSLTQGGGPTAAQNQKIQE